MIFTCNNFKGFDPFGTAAVVTADDAVEAAALLNTALVERGLQGGVCPDQMDRYEGGVEILLDGKY